MNEIQFCYWLQGYFEIAPNPQLTEGKFNIIKYYLYTITEERLPFIAWLKAVCSYLEITNNQAVTLADFVPAIQASLNAVFYHVIDSSYTSISREDRLHIHHEGMHD